MRVAIINSVCKEKSTGSIAYGLYKYIKAQGNQSRVYFGRGKEQKENDLIKIDSEIEVNVHAGLSRLTGLQGYFSNKATHKLLGLLEEYEPDIVYLLNLHGYYLNEFKLLHYLKSNKIKTVYIMPDEYPFLGKCCYSKNCNKYQDECNHCELIQDYPKSIIFDQAHRIFEEKKKIYNGFNQLVFATVPYTAAKARRSNLLKNQKVYDLDWGIDTKDTYNPIVREEIFAKYGIPLNKIIILTVAPFEDTRKGVKEYFYQCAKKNTNKNICFINVGYNGKEEKLSNNFLPIPYVKNQKELAQIYALSDLYVTASMNEAMPIAGIISLVCGTPICCFNTSGLPYLAKEPYGHLIEPGSLEEMHEYICKTVKKTSSFSSEIREYAVSRYSDIKFYEKLIRIGKEI